MTKKTMRVLDFFERILKKVFAKKCALRKKCNNYRHNFTCDEYQSYGYRCFAKKVK